MAPIGLHEIAAAAAAVLDLDVVAAAATLPWRRLLSLEYELCNLPQPKEPQLI